MTRPNDRCFVCGTQPRDGDPAIPDEYYSGLWCHLSCLNSPEGIAWRERRRQADPGFARYLRLSTVGLRMNCPACGRESRVSAKARGMGAGAWEACCTRCSRVTFLDGSAHEAEYEQVTRAERTFLLDEHSTEWRTQVANLARSADGKLRARRCPCGGRFSLAAEPRCPHCRTVLLDSFFHYADVASPEVDPASPAAAE